MLHILLLVLIDFFDRCSINQDMPCGFQEYVSQFFLESTQAIPDLTYNLYAAYKQQMITTGLLLSFLSSTLTKSHYLPLFDTLPDVFGMKKLVDMNNYGSGMAIISGLQVQCVHRLSATWAALSSRDRSTFRKLVELFSQDQNYTNLRTAVDNARLPCIPYLGVYLSDLTYIDVAASAAAQHQNSSTVWSQQVKQDRINNVLRTIANFQQSHYPFAIDEKVIAYLESQRYIEELQRFIEDANYKLSLRLEPPTSGGFSTSTESSFALSTRHPASASVLKPVPVQPSTSPIKTISGNAVLHCNNDEKPQFVKSATSSPTSHKLTRHLVDLFVPPLLPPPPKHPHAHRQPVRAHEAPVPLHPGSNSVPRNLVMPSHRRLGSWTGKLSYSLLHIYFSIRSENVFILCRLLFPF
ncbi:RasGEF domain protein, partial [Opisthorchis viverrini]